MSKKISKYGLLIIILVFASFLRFYHLGNFGIFGDEKQGIMVAVGNTNIGGQKTMMNPDKTFTPRDFWQPKTLSQLFDANARGDTSGNAIIHLLMMNVFGKVFGHSDFALRSVSVMANLLTILVIFLIGKNILKSTKIGLLAAFLASIEPFFIVYSQQARFYTTAIFLATLASYYFLQILFLNKSTLRYYVGYTLAITGSLFSNYLTFTMLIAHGLVWILADRSMAKFKNLSICYTVMLIPFVFWMTKGPGQYAIMYIKDATNLYKSILNDPKLVNLYKGFVDIANVENLSKRSITIISDFFIFTNGLYDNVGYRFAVVGLILFFIYIFYVIFKGSDAYERKIFLFIGLIITIPFLFALVSAYITGLMTGFYFRYTALGLPFVSILMAWAILKTMDSNKIMGLGLGLILAFQGYSVVKILKEFYQDNPQKYSSSHGRNFNPYITLSKRIEMNYQAGDTILYPSEYTNVFSTVIKRETKDFDNIDAQLCNLYLPKDATFIQRIDINEKNRVILVTKNNQKTVLFNFEGKKYRY